MTTGTSTPGGAEFSHGIRENLEQFLHQLLQVLLVGFAIGMMRTVGAIEAMRGTAYSATAGALPIPLNALAEMVTPALELHHQIGTVGMQREVRGALL